MAHFIVWHGMPVDNFVLFQSHHWSDQQSARSWLSSPFHPLFTWLMFHAIHSHPDWKWMDRPTDPWHPKGEFLLSTRDFPWTFTHPFSLSTDPFRFSFSLWDVSVSIPTGQTKEKQKNRWEIERIPRFDSSRVRTCALSDQRLKLAP